MKQTKTMCSAVLLGSVMSVLAAGFASAGDSYPPPTYTKSEPASMWNWFIGASGGVQGDDAEEFWSGHVGMEWKDGCNSHAIFLDVAFTDIGHDEDYGGPPVLIPGGPLLLAGDELKMDLDVLPVTLNYKYEYSFSENFGWYIGAGAGIAFIDSDLTLNGDDLDDGTDQVFYAQVFTGLVWNVNESFEVYGGARYYYLDEVNLGDDEFETGDSLDDWIVEAGIRFNF